MIDNGSLDGRVEPQGWEVDCVDLIRCHSRGFLSVSYLSMLPMGIIVFCHLVRNGSSPIVCTWFATRSWENRVRLHGNQN